MTKPSFIQNYVAFGKILRGGNDGYLNAKLTPSA